MCVYIYIYIYISSACEIRVQGLGFRCLITSNIAHMFHNCYDNIIFNDLTIVSIHNMLTRSGGLPGGALPPIL